MDIETSGDDYIVRVFQVDDLIWSPTNPICTTVPDLYVQLQVGTVKKETQRIRSSLTPNWDQILVFREIRRESSDVLITIKHHSASARFILGDPIVAMRRISLSDLEDKCNSGEAVLINLEPSGVLEVFLQKLHSPLRRQHSTSQIASEKQSGDFIQSKVGSTGTITALPNVSSTIIIDEDSGTLDDTSAQMDNLSLLLKRLDIKGRITIGKKPIGKGGSGNVYKGYCFMERRGTVIIAAKEIRQNILDDKIEKAFEREIYVWAKLNHVNVLPILGCAYNNAGDPLLISEWMENGSVREYISKTPDCDILHLIHGISCGLAHLHSCNIIHSDVKPDNILVNKKGEAMISDFGCSRIFEATRTIGLPTYDLKGTWNYMAPEIFNGSKEISTTPFTKEMDVWAFGMTVYEILTHTRPYKDYLPGQIAKALSDAQLPLVPLSFRTQRDIDQDTRLLLWTICKLCWKQEPNERPHMNTLVDILAKRSSVQLPIYDIDPNVLLPESMCEGQDWFAIFNPYTHRRGKIVLKHTIGHSSSIGGVQFSNDGKLLAVGCHGAAHFYDSETSEHRFTLNVDSVVLDILRFHPDGKHVVTAGRTHNGANPASNIIYIWNLASKQITQTFEGSTEDVIIDLSFANDGTRFVTSSFGKSYILIWDVQSKAPMKHESGSESISNASFYNDDRYIIAGSGSDIFIWDANSMEVIKKIKGHDHQIWPIRCVPDGRKFISGCIDGTMKMWSIESTSEAEDKLDSARSTSVNSISSHNLPGTKDRVSCIAVSSDGRYVASTGLDKYGAMYYDSRTGEVLFMIKIYGGRLGRMDMNSSGNAFVTGDWDGIVRIWSLSEL